MLKHTLSACAGAALLVVSIQAQSAIYYPNNSLTTGSCNVIPFGTGTNSSSWKDQKYQVLVPASAFKKKVGRIQTLGFARCSAGLRTFDRLVIRMDYIKASAMSTTFSANITSKAVTVLDVTKHDWPSKGRGWVRIGLQNPFLYLPTLGNLIVEVTTYNSAGASASCLTGNGSTGNPAVPRLYATASRWSNGMPPPTGSLGSSSGLKMEFGYDKGALDEYGGGCLGSNGKPSLSLSGSATLGGSVAINLTNAPASASVWFAAGFGLLAKPLALAPARGCSLYVRPDIVGLMKATSGGTLAMKAAIPKGLTALLGTKIYAQFVPVDPKANNFGGTTSNYGRAFIGR